MRILALDPGPVQTGWAYLVDGKIEACGKEENNRMLSAIVADRTLRVEQTVVIEMIASYGMPVGVEVFETCVWIGRFKQAHSDPDAVRFMYRKDVKMHLCGATKAKDGNIRQALIDRFGKPGTKKNPGGTYGISGDMWAALAVAVTAHDKEPERVAYDTSIKALTEHLHEITRPVGKRSASNGKPKRRVQVGAVPVARVRVRIGQG